MGNHSPRETALPAVGQFGLIELSSASGLRAQFLPSGALHALRHGDTLLNQVLPGPAEDGLFRLLVRWRGEDGVAHWSHLTGPATAFDAAAVPTWRVQAGPALTCVTTFTLHPTEAAWAWRVSVTNRSTGSLSLDVLHAQDLGLADVAAVRNNEAYVSQYLDLLPLADAELGHVVLARQNQAMSGGRRPWAAFACAERAAHFATDGWQFFGADHRLTREPLAARAEHLPSQRLQYEFAVAGLQSARVAVAPGETRTFTFFARFVPDHPEVSSPADLARLRELLPLSWVSAAAPEKSARARPPAFFCDAGWFPSERPSAADLQAWFPGEHRHHEHDAVRGTLSFFHGRNTHVVTQAKEALVARPHGHILRSGDASWIDDDQFGLTAYACGIFGAQVYLGNPSLARLLSVARNGLDLTRACGQRVFLRASDGGWRQLGVPTVFVMEPGALRWLYRAGEVLIEARVWCSATRPASFLELSVLSGPPQEFLVTHQLVLGANEFDAGGRIMWHEAAGWAALQPDPACLLAQHWPRLEFAIAAQDPRDVAALGGGELLGESGATGPYVVLRTRAVSRCGVILAGSHQGDTLLAVLVRAAREEFKLGEPSSLPPEPPVDALGGCADAGVARVNEILPWFTHNAAIHFSAPHGLEQYGGAAWGVRDVCQGSVEWLLAAGEFAIVRRILATVFAQQYATAEEGSLAGGWPQWFMFEPFRFIQQAHSHGDVCFWPLKALCDYVEASGDIAFLQQTVAYTDPHTFRATRLRESLWAHCDRVVDLCEQRFVPGTALVNYGDGDWDDTLQPADPAMRTRMISAWTVGLAYHAFRQFAEVCRRAREQARAARLERILTAMRRDFLARLMPAGTVAGFLITDPDGHARPLLHPHDQVTGIRYRLLPMTRAMLAELFTPEEAVRHLAIIERELKFTDGVRLMSEPAAYHGGAEKLFKRAETAANVGREIGLQYVHAHLRYAEAMAKLGEAEKLWEALQVVNPVALEKSVPRAVARQSNVYFSSSDADFADRAEATARWAELRAGRVPVRGGWRLYSSGPGLYLHKLRASLLGVRESFGDIVFDPVLPRCLDGLSAETRLCGRRVRLTYAVRHATSGPQSLRINGQPVEADRESNPYRTGGLRVPASTVSALLNAEVNVIQVEL